MGAPAVVDEYLHALSAGDAGRVLACVTDDFRNEHTAALGSSSAGRAEYAARLPGFLAQFAALQYEVTGAVSEGDETVVRYRLTANFDGHPIDIAGVMWFVIRNDLIARRTDVWDSLTFLRQTGMVDER